MKNILLLIAVFACFYSEKIDAMSIQNEKRCEQSSDLSIPKNRLQTKCIKDRSTLSNLRKVHVEINKNQNRYIETLAAEQLLCLKHSNSSLISNNTEEISKLRSVFLSHVGNLLKLRKNEAMLHQKIRKHYEELCVWEKELRELQDHIKKIQLEKKYRFFLLDQAKNLTKQ